MLIPSVSAVDNTSEASLSRRVNANSQLVRQCVVRENKLIKKGEC